MNILKAIILALLILVSKAAVAENIIVVSCDNFKGYAYYFGRDKDFSEDGSSGLTLNLVMTDEEKFDVSWVNNDVMGSVLNEGDILLPSPVIDNRISFTHIPNPETSESPYLTYIYMFDLENMVAVKSTYRYGSVLPKADIQRGDCKAPERLPI